MWEPEFAGHIERGSGPSGQPGGGREKRWEPVVGVMVHFDGSSRDAGGVSWFRDRRAWNVGYSYYVLDDGSYHTMGPKGVPWAESSEYRVYHAGICRPSAAFRERAPYHDANSAFVGISAAATDGDDQDPVVELAIATLARRVLERAGLDPFEIWRVTGHEDEAWPRGRKHDPTGLDPTKPVVDMRAVRHLIPALGDT